MIILEQLLVKIVKQELSQDLTLELLHANHVLQCTLLKMMLLKNVDIVLQEHLITFHHPSHALDVPNLQLVIALVEDKLFKK